MEGYREEEKDVLRAFAAASGGGPRIRRPRATEAVRMVGRLRAAGDGWILRLAGLSLGRVHGRCGGTVRDRQRCTARARARDTAGWRAARDRDDQRDRLGDAEAGVHARLRAG